MLSHLFDVLALGLDSLAMGWLIGPWMRSRRNRWHMALAFGLCDAVGTLVGQGLPEWRWAIAAVGVVVCVGYPAIRGSRAAVMGLLPVLFGIDSVLFPVDVSDVLVVGLVSAALAYCGLAASSAGFAAFGSRRAWQAVFVLAPCGLLLL